MSEDTEMSATHQALNTPEILQMILYTVGSQPSAADLLHTQRVCRYWHSLINTSHQLQRQLYLRPELVANRAPRAFDPTDRPRNNLLLKRALQGRYPTMSVNTERIKRKKLGNSSSNNALAKRTANSSLSVGSSPVVDKNDEINWAWDVTLSMPADLSSANTAITSVTAKDDGSNPTWKRMFLTQPPCTALYLTRGCQRDVTPVLTRPDGITVGELVEAVVEGQNTWNKGWLGLDGEWHLEGQVEYSCL